MRKKHQLLHFNLLLTFATSLSTLFESNYFILDSMRCLPRTLFESHFTTTSFWVLFETLPATKVFNWACLWDIGVGKCEKNQTNKKVSSIIHLKKLYSWCSKNSVFLKIKTVLVKYFKRNLDNVLAISIKNGKCGQINYIFY